MERVSLEPCARANKTGPSDVANLRSESDRCALPCFTLDKVSGSNPVWLGNGHELDGKLIAALMPSKTPEAQQAQNNVTFS